MNQDTRLLKIEILINQKKFQTAEQVISDLLTEESNNVQLLALLAQVNFQQNKFDVANKIIDNAISLSPDFAYLFYIKAYIAIGEDNLDEAQKNINQAIQLDSYEADFFALKANIKLQLKNFEEALKIANQALEIDAENILALNIRSTALNKLNRTEESFETIEGALREDPNNPHTHANYGWGLLEKGNYKKALIHFKESLSIDPTSQYAQAGMLQAIKATNPIYRMFLKYSFWMSNLTANYQWAVIIGFFFGFRALRTLAQNNEILQPFLIPIIILLALLAFSTWIITPISNLFLRFNRYGQLLLDKKEKISSNLVAVSLGVFFLGLLLYFILLDEKMLVITIFGFGMMPPLGTMFSPSKNKNALVIYSIVLATIGFIAILITFSTGEIFNSMLITFLFGFTIFGWLANYILIKDNN